MLRIDAARKRAIAIGCCPLRPSSAGCLPVFLTTSGGGGVFSVPHPRPGGSSNEKRLPRSLEDRKGAGVKVEPRSRARLIRRQGNGSPLKWSSLLRPRPGRSFGERWAERVLPKS